MKDTELKIGKPMGRPRTRGTRPTAAAAMSFGPGECIHCGDELPVGLRECAECVVGNVPGQQEEK